MDAARRRAGSERGFAPYALRHAFVAYTLRNQADIRAVAELVGHADESRILRVYDYVDDLARCRWTLEQWRPSVGPV